MVFHLRMQESTLAPAGVFGSPTGLKGMVNPQSANFFLLRKNTERNRVTGKAALEAISKSEKETFRPQ